MSKIIRFHKDKLGNQIGAMPLLIIIVVISFLGFFIVASLGDFKDRVFQSLFTKPSSFAAQELNVVFDKNTVATIEAESGNLTDPMAIDQYNSNIIFHKVTNTSDPLTSGKAEYTFTVPEDGNYIVRGLVNAKNTNNDSFFLNIDNEPDSTMVWDIVPLTTNFEERVVSWRGNGTAENNQFQPKVFSLTAGTHTLIVRGREGYTYVDKFIIEKYSNAIEAENGSYTEPFALDQGLLYHKTSNTGDPSNSGKVSYSFNVLKAGKYIIKAKVNAKDIHSDSFYLNIDQEPTPSMIWDIYPSTNGIEERIVSHRGSGTFDKNEFSPKIFDLNPGQHTLIIRGRDGYTYLDKISIESYTTPSTVSSEIEAESGVLAAPMTLDPSKTMIFQSSSNTSNPLSGGKAEYTFSVSETGNYVIRGLVNARTISNDSFFVNVDSEPTGIMIWDIYPLTVGTEERTVSWRGTGTSDKNEFAPKIFNLTAGSHKLIFRGRDAYTYLDKIKVVKYSGEEPNPTFYPTPVPTFTPTPTPTSSAPVPTPLPTATPPTGQLRTYWHGVNYAWWYFGRDFGDDNSFGQGVRELYSTHDQNFAKIKNHGGKVVRWFMFPDYDQKKTIIAGQAPSAQVMDDIAAAVELAKKHDLYLQFAFLSFPEMPYLVDKGYTDGLVNKTFIPILQRFGQESNILGWDVMNESDWAIREDPAVRLEPFRYYANLMITAVRTYTNQKVTASAGTPLYRDYYRNLNVDFYEFHRYNNDINYPSMDVYSRPASDWGMNKPIVIGEMQDLGSNIPLPYEKAWELGYQGAWGWCSNNDFSRCDPDAKHKIDWVNLKGFADKYSAQIKIK